MEGRSNRGGRGGGSASSRAHYSSRPTSAVPVVMFPVGSRDTSTFALPTDSPSVPTSSSSKQQHQKQQKQQPQQSRPKSAVVIKKKTVTTRTIVSAHHHQPIESKEDDEDDEDDDEFDFDDDDDSDEYDFEDDEDLEFLEQDGENIFDMAEAAFVDGQQQAAKKKAAATTAGGKAPTSAAGKKQPRQKQIVIVTKAERLAAAAAAAAPQPRAPKPQKQPKQYQQPQQHHVPSFSANSSDAGSDASDIKVRYEAALAASRQALKEAKLLKKLMLEQEAADGAKAVPQQHQQQQPATTKIPKRQPKLAEKAKLMEQKNVNENAVPKQNKQLKQALAGGAPVQKEKKSERPASASQPNHAATSHNNHAGGLNNAHRNNARAHFSEHLSLATMQTGLRQGLYLQGILRIIGSNAFVTVAGLQRDVFVEGRKGRNRGFDGDTVCVQIIGFDTGVGTKQTKVKETGKGSKNAASKHSGLQASLDSLISNTNALEDEKMSAEKKLKSAEKADDSSSSSSATVAPGAALLARLSAVSPDTQHKGIVLGILQAKFPIVHAPGLLKPYGEHMALFVPSDKRTPFALLPERSWPIDFASVYKKYLGEQKQKKQDKVNAMHLRKKNGNFPAAQDGSSEVVNEQVAAASASSSDDDQVDVDAIAEQAESSDCLDPHVYVAVYQPWQVQDRLPLCSIQSNLGLSGTIRTETEALLIANGVDYDHNGAFPPEVLAEVASYSRESSNGSGGWQIPEEEIAKRRDYRDQTKWRIVSIDPTTARDLDDAIHIIDHGDDVVEIGVHIADVSHFLTENSALDQEAKHRATTIYLVDRAISMLPGILCEQLCSLNPNVDRLAYSCIFYISKSTGKLIESRKPEFFRSVIRTSCRLNYETAQLLMEFDDSKLNHEVTEEDFTGELRTSMTRGHTYRPVDCVSIAQLMSDMKLLHAVSMKRRADRFAVGSLTLSNVKLQFQTDEQRNPIGFYTYVIRDSNRVVEECMLLANLLVAHQCVTFCKSIALLRRHPAPNERSMTKVSQTCHELGFDIDASTAGALQASFAKYEGMLVGQEHGVNDATITEGTIPIRQVLEPLCTRPMQLAKYFCTGTMAENPKEWAHYALHFPEYTHFTSPIRRYADVIVHRVLTYSLELEAWQAKNGGSGKNRPKAPISLNQDEVTSISDTCNTRKANAKKAQEASSRVYLCDYLLRHHSVTPLTSSAVIIDMFAPLNHPDPSFDILIPHLGIEKKIHLTDLLRMGKVLKCDILPKDPPEVGKDATHQQQRAQQHQQKQQAQQKKGNRAERRAELQPNVVAAASTAAPVEVGVSTSSPPPAAPVVEASASSSSSSSPTPVSAPLVDPAAPVASKILKRLHITWCDGTSNVYAIFHAIHVELGVKRGPPVELDAFVISPAAAAELALKKESSETAVPSSSSSSSTPAVAAPTSGDMQSLNDA